MDYLDHPEDEEDEEEDGYLPPLVLYARMLFKTWPTLETFALCDFLELCALRLGLPGEPPDPGESIGICDKAAAVSRGFRKGEDDAVVGPVAVEFAQEGWRRYASS